MPKQILGSAPPPIQDSVTGQGGILTEPWRQWFARLPDTLSSIPARINAVGLTAQSASIAATDFSGGALLEGLYRATYYARITQAATTSSSLTVTFTWTEGGVLQTAVGVPIVGNTTATGQTDSAMMRLDKGTVPRYATTYASVGATAMNYSFNVILEKMIT
jgi:hypothetical protein